MVFDHKLTKNEFNILQKMQDFVAHAHADSESHDYAHLLSVCKNAMMIGKQIEEPVNPFNILAASLLHDIGKTNDIFSHIHGLLGGALAEEFLDGIHVDIEQRDKITRAVVRHTPTSFIPPETPLEMILYDADTLDRLGLMGLLRGFIGKTGMSMGEIIIKYMERRSQDYKKLHYKVSKRMGRDRNEELEAYIAIIQSRLDMRMQKIEDIFAECKE